MRKDLRQQKRDIDKLLDAYAAGDVELMKQIEAKLAVSGVAVSYGPGGVYLADAS